MERGPGVSVAVAVAGVLLVVAAAGPAVAGNGEYTLDLSPGVDTPPRMAELGSETYPVSSVGRVDPGETITAHVTAPPRDYRVVVYDTHRRRYAERRASGDATIRFDTTGWGTGSYLVAVEAGGDVVAIHPLVVSAYRLDVSAPAGAEPGSIVRVGVDLDATGTDVRVSKVTALVAGVGGEREARLEAVDGERYAGSLSLAGLPTGEYTLYLIVQGTRAQFEEQEIVAFHDQPLAIGTDPSAWEETPAEDGRAGDAHGTAGDEETPGTTTDPPPTGTGDETTDDADVITPAPTDGPGETVGEPAGLASWPVLLVIAVVVFVLLLAAYRIR